MPASCDECGGLIDQLRPGRIARFCSDNCRTKSHRATIPEIMRREHRWVTFDWPAKVPLQLDGGPASVTDPETWASYPQIRGRKAKGYVLGGNIGCIDIDHCRYPAAGELHPAVAEFISPLMSKTYIEVSPSGGGLHIFGLMAESKGWRRPLVDGVTVEACSRDRYVTVTGQRISKTSKLGHIHQHVLHLEPVLG